MSRHRLSVAALIASSLLCACTSVPSGISNGPVAHATGEKYQTLFNDGWLFAKEDPANASNAAFDDHAWRQLTLPHDWSIEEPFDQKWASSTAYLPAGIAWYRKHFSLPAWDAGQRIALRFDGVYEHSTVYLNGHEVGGRPYGYSSFTCELTPFLNPAGDNVLAVRVDHHTYADTRWYTGSGIYRNVYLVATNPIHVEQDGTFITTPEVSENSATLNIQTTLRDSTPQTNTVPLKTNIYLTTRIFDNAGHELTTTETPLVIAAGESSSLTEQIAVLKPSLWSIDHPTLYTAITEIDAKNGQVLDIYRTHFGIRAIHFDANTGFTLNGINIKMKGVCLHEDAGALGAAIPQQVWERRLRILKEAGTNAIRTSHNPPAPEFLDLCDRMGFVVMDEAFDEWTRGKKKWMDKWNGQKFSTDGYNTSFEQWADKDLQDMIRRDRNHPSIVMWSIGNEIDYPHDAYPLNSPELPPVAARLIADVKALDTTRPVTAADAAIASNLYYPQLDIVGYNYQEQRYAADHAQHPLQIIYGSENSTRTDAWLAVANNPYIFGQFLWTGIDYLGEARGWPIHGSAPGLLDTAGFPKPLYYLRQSLWASDPMVKIEPQIRGFGNRNGSGGNARLVCYTNCDTVEFFQNEKSLGERSPSTTTRTVEVPAFTAGTPLEAVGKRSGKPVAKDTFIQAGPPAAIVLREYATSFGPGDGPNVAQVELSITDSAGVLSPNASNDVAVTLAGNGKLLGIESGDLNSTEDPRAGHRKALRGRLIIYVETHGPVTLTATTAGLPSVSVQIATPR